MTMQNTVVLCPLTIIPPAFHIGPHFGGTMKNMVKLLLISLICAVLLALSLPAHARNVKMIFWYPGEAGSTTEAQPVLDAFLEYINKKIAPDRIVGRYFNDVTAGLQYIMKEKPVMGIISYAAWMQNSSKLGNSKVLLATLPFPHGQQIESYSIVGLSPEIKANAKILSSEPLELNFVKQQLFAQLPDSVTITQTPQLFAMLKKIADGSLDSSAILTPNEVATIAGMSAPWAKLLKIVTQSKPVPTARVVIFDQNWAGAEKFQKTLLSLANDPAAKPILDEMRLMGFAETQHL